MDLKEKLLKLKELTDQFHDNIKQYKSDMCDEANTRVDFIDKLFILLDWDVTNNQRYSESYRDVVREDKIQIEGKQKAPDYSFRIGGVRKFFVEAKKPSVNIKEDISPAFQIRRYGYTAKLPLSILTDFEEFAIYDTRIKPDKNDKASVGRVFYCTYTEYEKNFDFIYNTFSKNAILKGSFDKYIEENKNKKGTGEVDKELLKLVEDWRTELAKNIALRNNEIDIYNLNNAVQKIIDRIIFLRIAEDKEIEPYEQLLSITKIPNSSETHDLNRGLIYQRLNEIFVKANKKYNAGLFQPENWLAELKIDDKILSAIIKGLYYPECPYEFSILPIEILGNIYEQFLGKTIRFRNVKDGHTAIIEEKPEVRKAGGVYYTPQYIVNYIVENTIGNMLNRRLLVPSSTEGKSSVQKELPMTPDEISGNKGLKPLAILDPACGSGSFLVGAYQYLLNYHIDYWSNEKNIKKALKEGKIYQVSSPQSPLDKGGRGDYKLTIEEKQKILINNIHGVDIDPQAVEVTKLSLYLKLLENEGKEATGFLFKHSDIKLLPTLDKNIKCGNSLIGSDFYTTGS
ncbi:MAG TPA: type I restriction endonuclease, partial [Spirochaetota bacterium]|nr:type I restriction endonuclease [Spirochaetota bacterium]